MKITGIILSGWMCISASGLLYARDNCQRSHLDKPVTITDSMLSRHLSAPGIPTESSTVEVRAALAKAKERRGMSKTRWGITLTSPSDTLDVSLHFGNTDFGDMLDRRIAVITVTRRGATLYHSEVDGMRMSAGSLNTLSLTLSEGQLHISGGGERSKELCEVNLTQPFTATDAHVWSQGELLVTVFSSEICQAPHFALATDHTPESLQRRFTSAHDPVEGYWTYFDRSNDPMYARLGGQYTLAVVRNDSIPSADRAGASYDIVYISGAKTLGHYWKPMMLKGRLRPTIFQGHYDLEWTDSTFDTITEDIHAILDSDDALLTLAFPLLKTTIRFSKAPIPQSYNPNTAQKVR